MFTVPSPAFHFDAGENPQYNQTWNLNQELEIAGYRIKIESARAATFDDIKDNPDIWDPNGGPDYPDGSQGYDTGYQFAVNYDAPVSNVALDIQSDSCWLYDARPATPIATMFYTELCRGGYPKGIVNVMLSEISILVEHPWQTIWQP